MRLLPLLLAATALPFAPAVAQTPPAAVAPIGFTERTLANGLRVYAIRDTSTPNVSVQVWYDVGSKDDPKDRSGFAHMFEHLMFKATRNLVPEQMDRLTEDVGGYNNASTADDYTNYYELVPANHLQRLLFAEADRMASLVVEPTSYASERDVVKEELRSRVLAEPYGKLYYLYYPMTAYARHPYARPGIGSLENLDAATIDDVRAFHATYYRPDNAVLVVSGNFDAAQLDKWVNQYFAKIARPARAIPRVTVAEPARTKAARYTVYEANTPLPAVLMSWHVPADRGPDTPALAVLDAILATGESSRLYQNLVYRDGLAQSVESFLDTKQSTGNLVALAMLASGKDTAAGEAALRREVARLRGAPVSETELAEAKNELLTAAIRARETAEGKANTLAQSVIVDGDPRASDRQVAAIAGVTAADIQRVARKYLGDAQSATIHYLPAELAKGAKSDAIALAPSVEVAALTTPPGIVAIVPATAAQRIAPPAPAAPLAATPLRPIEARLSNGMRLVVVNKPGQPIVTAALVAPGGGALDRAGKAGTASLAAEVLTKGTATRSATQIARDIEALGGSISADADRDGASIDVTVKSDQLAPALGILADVARNPAFATEEVARAKAQAIDAAKVAVADPATLAGLIASRAVFGAGTYGNVLAGTPASLAGLTPADLRASYAATWRPDRATLLLVGDITADAAKVAAEAAFGGWCAAPVAEARVEPAILANAPTPRVTVIDMPGAGQAAVVVARTAPSRRDADYYRFAVANAVLGTGFSSRLNQEVRIKRGLAYGASSRLSARRAGGIVAAATQTKNETATEVVKLVTAEMARLGTPPAPAAAEIDTRKAVLVGNFGRATETTDGIAGVVGGYVAQDVPLAELATYAASVEGVSPDAVVAAAKRYLDTTGASIVVVGDAKIFVEALRGEYPALEVVPADKVAL